MFRTVSAEQIATAIELGGYPIARGNYILADDKSEKITVVDDFEGEIAKHHYPVLSACAIGQAALNLGVGCEELNDVLTSENIDVIRMNDKEHRTLKQIARAVRKTLKGLTFEIREVDWTSFSNYQGKKV